MNRNNIRFEEAQENWYLKRIAEHSTLSFAGAVREATDTHPEFIEDQKRLESDPAFAAEYAVQVDKGRAIRKQNIRR